MKLALRRPQGRRRQTPTIPALRPALQPQEQISFAALTLILTWHPAFGNRQLVCVPSGSMAHCTEASLRKNEPQIAPCKIFSSASGARSNWPCRFYRRNRQPPHTAVHRPWRSSNAPAWHLQTCQLPILSSRQLRRRTVRSCPRQLPRRCPSVERPPPPSAHGHGSQPVP